MKFLIQILLLLLLYSNTFSIILPPEEDDIYFHHYKYLMDLNKSSYYFFQLNFQINYVKANGFYKKLSENFLSAEYGLRLTNNKKIEHKYRFLLVDYNGIFYNTIGKYGDTENDTLTGKYLINYSGIKLLDINNLENYLVFTVIQLSTDLIFEHRPFTIRHPWGLPYQTKNHNFYLLPSISIALNKINLNDANIRNADSIKKQSFWDIPVSTRIEIGYEWKQEKWGQYQSKVGFVDYYYQDKNSLFCFLKYNYYPYNYLKELSYGIESHIDLSKIIRDITLSYEHSILTYGDSKNDFDKFKISYVLPNRRPSWY
jgi:hypothetical protein